MSDADDHADSRHPSQLDLLRAHGIRPVKRRGQNFLLDTNLARAIARDVISLGDHVVELGAGGGALTVHLLDGGAQVTAVEVDRKLCALLTAEYGARSAFRLVEGDLAKLDWTALLDQTTGRPVIAGNLPYVLTSTVLFSLAALRGRVAGGVFMIQKEVAARLVAQPGGREYGVLTVLLGAVFALKIVRTVPATVFWPRPEVASAVVRLEPRGELDDATYARFARVVKKLFAQRRKQLGTQLRAQFGLTSEAAVNLAQAAGLASDARPEQIDVAGYLRLTEQLRKESQ